MECFHTENNRIFLTIICNIFTNEDKTIPSRVGLDFAATYAHGHHAKPCANFCSLKCCLFWQMPDISRPPSSKSLPSNLFHLIQRCVITAVFQHRRRTRQPFSSGRALVCCDVSGFVNAGVQTGH